MCVPHRRGWLARPSPNFLPISITDINSCSFSGCSALHLVKIGNGVTNIGAYVFDYCSNIDTLYCMAVDPPTLQEHAFRNVNREIPLFVPCGRDTDSL